MLHTSHLEVHMAKVASQQVQQFSGKPTKGLFRTFREIGSSLGELTVNGIDGLIFEQRKAQLRDRLIGDAEFFSSLQENAKQFGGIDACKVVHNELINLLKDLEL